MSDQVSSSSSAVQSSAASISASGTKYTGRVKWFNNKYGYGFITVISTDEAASVAIGADVFAHHSEVAVGEDQYRYLVQGEYVEFSVVKTTSGNHEYQCAKVRGIHGGQLICETRHAARAQYKTSAPASANSTQPPQSSASAASVPGERRFAGVKPTRGRGGSVGGFSGRGGFRH
jgi:cold shock CspA family protein